MLNVVVVDDSMVVRKSITNMLTQMGHIVVGEAKNGNEAITQFEKLSPDLITMDIVMPDMDGITAVKGIRKISQAPKIIMITSHGHEEMVLKAIKAGACGYVLKPVNYEKLEQAIAKVFPELKEEKEKAPDSTIRTVSPDDGFSLEAAN